MDVPERLLGPKTRDPGPILCSQTWDPRPKTLKVGPETPDPGTQLIGETRDPKFGTQDPRYGALTLHGT